jgi:hypothetical protein
MKPKWSLDRIPLPDKIEKTFRDKNRYSRKEKHKTVLA